MTEKALNNTDLVKTSDFGLAGFLFLSSPLETIERPENGRKSLFVFKKDSQIDDLINIFWRGQAKVEPQAYFNALRLIKARLYGGE